MARGRGPGKCIFCGNTGVTKEHLFSDWLRELFPRSREDSHTLARLIAWEPKPTVQRTVKQGHSGSRTARKVCGKCNSGWISQIDQAAKNFAPPLIQGQSHEVTLATQRAIAAWFSKIVMVADAADPTTMVITQADRDWIRCVSLPPLIWEVWIGSYEGTGWRDLAMQHHSGALNIAAIANPKTLSGHFHSGYASATTFGLGKLLVLVMAKEFSLLYIDINIGLAALRMRRIWPSHETFAWPLAESLTDDDVGAIANLLREATSNFRPPTD